MEDLYYEGKPCKHGHGTRRYIKSKRCVTCANNDANRRYEKKKEQYLKKSNEYYHENKAVYRESRQKYYLENKEEILRRNKKWKDTHKKERAAESAKRRAAKLQRTPTWANLETIKDIYRNCPDGHHVDHIVPLVNNIVSGLHVENNLQYLPSSENCSKNNYFKVLHTLL